MLRSVVSAPVRRRRNPLDRPILTAISARISGGQLSSGFHYAQPLPHGLRHSKTYLGQGVREPASSAVSTVTKVHARTAPPFRTSPILREFSIGVQGESVNNWPRHRQRVAGRPNPRQIVVYACPSAPSLTGAGGQSVGLYGGRCVGAFGPAGLLTTVCPGLEPAPSATRLHGGVMPIRQGSRHDHTASFFCPSR